LYIWDFSGQTAQLLLNDKARVPNDSSGQPGKEVVSVSTFSSFFSFRPNTSLGPLSFTFVSHRSFKFQRFQIGPLSFEFVSDWSFKFIRFQIGPYVSSLFQIGPLTLA